ncbi:MAG TPA: Glu/Leu/Phe/Val dehydrogenase dimerization domain-containing protein [Methylomirabilota bacterium]|nr:Glu/Leu/Phe/Val dehydrogenase dimerization domain-containing protein [Methylomirabilota bacterium]
MKLFQRLCDERYEQVVFCHDGASGLRSIIAIHDTTLGPALGGVRMWRYPSEEEALEDCLRLAAGMTMKAAVAGVNLGGGKSVIIGDPATDKTEALLKAHGRFIQTLGGRYIPGIDVGTDMADLEMIATQVDVVSCVNGDPSPMTALGVVHGIRTCLEAVHGSDELGGRTVAVQGVGHVGTALAEQLAGAGARLILADLDDRRANAVAARLGAQVAGPDEVLSMPCDVLAPCAMSGVVDDRTVGGLRCRIVAGSANSVLGERRHGEDLHAAGILYAPDYCINAGGLILIEEEALGHDVGRAERRVRGVGQIIRRVIERARRDRVSTSRAADLMATERLQAMRNLGPPYVAARR